MSTVDYYGVALFILVEIYNVVDSELYSPISNQALEQEIKRGSLKPDGSPRMPRGRPRLPKLRAPPPPSPNYMTPYRPYNSGPPPPVMSPQMGMPHQYPPPSPQFGAPPQGPPGFHPNYNSQMPPYPNYNGYPQQNGYCSPQQNGYTSPQQNGYGSPYAQQNGYSSAYPQQNGFNGYQRSPWSSPRLEVVPPPIPLQTYLEVGCMYRLVLVDVLYRLQYIYVVFNYHLFFIIAFFLPCIFFVCIICIIILHYPDDKG